MRLAHLRPDPEERPATFYLAVPPSDISRTKPLIRLVLNQIGRRLTLPDHVAIVRETTNAPAHEEFAVIDDEPEDAARQARVLRQQMRGLARQASLDPADGLEL